MTDNVGKFKMKWDRAITFGLATAGTALDAARGDWSGLLWWLTFAALFVYVFSLEDRCDVLQEALDVNQRAQE